jgi:hypothetical protein
MVMILGWQLGFGFEMKLAWGGIEGFASNLYRCVGRVQKD